MARRSLGGGGGHCQAVCLKGIRDPSDEEGGRVREEGRLARIELIQKYAQKPASTGGVRATRKKHGWKAMDNKRLAGRECSEV